MIIKLIYYIVWEIFIHKSIKVIRHLGILRILTYIPARTIGIFYQNHGERPQMLPTTYLPKITFNLGNKTCRSHGLPHDHSLTSCYSSHRHPILPSNSFNLGLVFGFGAYKLYNGRTIKQQIKWANKSRGWRIECWNWNQWALWLFGERLLRQEESTKQWFI